MIKASMRTILLFAGMLLSLLAAAAADYPVMKLGTPAPDFSLPGVDDRNYSLKDFADAKLLTIIFTCNHCPTAQAYEERIKQLVSDYRPRGVAFLAINPNSPEAVRFDELGYTDLDDTLESMKIRAEHKQFNFPYVDDGPTQVTSKKFGPIATPHVFIFDEQRKLRFQGRIDDNERESLGEVPRHPRRSGRAPGREAAFRRGNQGVRLLHQVGRQSRIKPPLDGTRAQGARHDRTRQR